MSAYLFIHLYYTVPVALLLHYTLNPLRNSRDVFKLFTLILIATIYTTPWDSYLIRSGIWSYKKNEVLATVWSIPVEEYFFFVVQTYITTSLYSILSKPILFPLYLNLSARIGLFPWIISLVPIFSGLLLANGDSKTTYLGRILLWSGPILAFLFLISYSSLLVLPRYVIGGTIFIPTVYLCIVDNIALRNGVWTIEKHTKLDYHVFGSLDIEEATFFLITNTMICLGLVACDKAFAIMDVFPDTFPSGSNSHLIRAVKHALFHKPLPLERQYIKNITDASRILEVKSKSFHLASMAFPNRSRISLVSIYALCRVMDDLVDEAPNAQSAEKALAKIESFIDKSASGPLINHSTHNTFSHRDKYAFMLLPRLLHYIPVALFTQLVQGFKTDIQFLKATNISEFPIRTESDLVRYCECVASTVARMFVYAIWNAESAYPVTTCRREWVLDHATKMGVALQLINIARDIIQDACNGRLYIPLDWARSLEERAELDELMKNPHSPAVASVVQRYSLRLVRMARFYYSSAVAALNSLPPDCTKGARLAVDVYMGIGDEILRRHGDISHRVSLNRTQKIAIVFKTLYK